jgi:hypothetical protein
LIKDYKVKKAIKLLNILKKESVKIKSYYNKTIKKVIVLFKQLVYYNYNKVTPAGVFIQEQCKMIRGRLRRRRRQRAQPAPVSVTQEKIEWARQREQEYSCQSKKAVLTEWRECEGLTPR